MSFLSGAFLFALPLALVPVAVHLYRRRQRDLVPWGAMQFLQEAAKQGRRWERLEELLLLLARCAVVLALVLALARPQLLGEWLGDQPTREVVLVLDNSLSMSRRVDEATPFAQLQERAGALINQLHGSDRLQYLLAVGGPDWQTPESLSADAATKADAIGRIATLEPTLGAADLLTSVQAAVDAGSSDETQSRHIYIVTDMQAHGWRIEDDRSWRRLREAVDSSGVPTFVHVVPCGVSTGPIDNVAVTSIETSQTQVGTAESVVLQIEVQNAGDQLSSPRVLEQMVDGEVWGTSPIPSLAAGESVSVSWTWSADVAGVYALNCRLTSQDQLAGDDEDAVVVNVVDRVPVLIVESPPTYGQRVSEAALFASAIGYDRTTPHSDWHSVYAPTFVSIDDLEGESLSGYRAIVIPCLTLLPPEAVEKLRGFVEHGGGLWIGLGRRTDLESFNALWYDEGSGLSPLPLAGRLTYDDDPVSTEMIHPPAADHFATAALADTNRLDVDKVRIESRLAFDRTAARDDLSVLLETGDGDPLVIEHYVGRGRVILQGLPFDVESSNLPLTKAFVVMVNDWLEYLTQPAATQFNLAPGGRLELPTSMIGLAADAVLVTPDGRERTLAARETNDAAYYHFSQTRLPGLYEVRSADATADVRSVPFHVARDPQESVLTVLDPAAQEFLHDGAGMSFSETMTDVVPRAASVPKPRSLWIPLLAGCVVLLAAELLLATWAAGLRSRSGAEFSMAGIGTSTADGSASVTQSSRRAHSAK